MMEVSIKEKTGFAGQINGLVSIWQGPPSWKSSGNLLPEWFFPSIMQLNFRSEQLKHKIILILFKNKGISVMSIDVFLATTNEVVVPF